MEEIKVGEYIRLKWGTLDKVRKVENDKIFISHLCGYSKNEVKKHSLNIIDLIEPGDYVNKRLVLQVDYKNKNVCLLISFTDTKANTNIMWYGQEDIKSIVTKEQLKQAEYKI